MPAPLIMGAAAVAARLAAKKAASNVVKKAATKKLVKEAAKRKPLATPKSGVKVKPAAKQIAGKKEINTFIAKRAIRNEKIAKPTTMQSAAEGTRGAPFSDGKTKLLRQVKASNKKK
jgi:hypothetical protein